MKWLRRFFEWLIFFSERFMNKFGKSIPTGKIESKPPRPQVKKVWISIIIDDQICQKEAFIIMLNGEIIFDAPIFQDGKEADAWLDKYYPADKYSF